MNRYFPGQRVRINCRFPAPRFSRFQGTITEIARICTTEETRRAGMMPGDVYVLALTDHDGSNVIAHEGALEPIFDQPQKISWQHSSVVWRPQFMDAPAVVRRKVRA